MSERKPLILKNQISVFDLNTNREDLGDIARAPEYEKGFNKNYIAYISDSTADEIKTMTRFGGNRRELCSKIVAFQRGAKIKFNFSENEVTLDANIFARQVNENTSNTDYSIFGYLTKMNKSNRNTSPYINEQGNIRSIAVLGTFIARKDTAIEVRNSIFNKNGITEKAKKPKN